MKMPRLYLLAMQSSAAIAQGSETILVQSRPAIFGKL
jgi:hypothetical protein